MYSTVDPAGSVLSVNSFADGHLGLTDEELVCDCLLRALPPGQPAEAHARLAENLARAGDV
jgi:hypothetical protein